ncbi:MAG: hypothetical protein U0074_08390 [Kouleothrix sp.]
MVAAFAITFAITFTLATVRSDGIEYYAYLRCPQSMAISTSRTNIIRRHSPDFFQQPTKTGHYENLAAIGPALVWAPLYSVGHLLVLAGRALGMPRQPDGYAAPYVVLAVFSPARSPGWRLCWQATTLPAGRWVAPPDATLAAITILLGSNLLYYTMREGSFAHALSGLAATLYVLAWLRLEERPTVALGIKAPPPGQPR